MSNNYEKLLNNTIKCKCGREHYIPIKKVVISKGCLKNIVDILNQLGFSNDFHLISDVNTHKIAGVNIENILNKKSIKFTKTIFNEPELIAYNTNVDKVINDLKDDTSVLIAIGSGTINDISRYAAFKTGKSYIIVATAPSMDGYASSVSPLVVDGFKNTYEAKAPVAIIGDLDILKNSPRKMIAAGFADIIGKYTSLADWKLSNLVSGEYYCDYVESIVRNAVEICVKNIDGLIKSEDEAIENLMHALILSGIGMLMIGNSRPASGAEHHLSHFWEMYFIKLGGHQPLHGEKVGIASIIISGFYNKILKYSKEEIKKITGNINILSKEEQIKIIESVFKDISNSVIKENFDNNPIFIENKKIYENWDKIVEISKTVPDSNSIKSMLESLGAVTRAEQLDIDNKLKNEGIYNCMYVRKKITILRLLSNLGLLKEDKK